MSNFKSFFKKHIDGVNLAMESINDADVSNLMTYIKQPHRNLFITGIGKNGHVAAKAASTFNSMGIKIFFINPVDAVHGDMGIIENDDIIIAISKTGNTDELENFLHHVSKRTKKICLIHSNKNNKCLKYCDNDFYIEIIDEADHLNKVPTISIAVYTIFLQTISCVLAHENNLDLKTFIFNHPGGSIGQTKI